MQVRNNTLKKKLLIGLFITLPILLVISVFLFWILNSPSGKTLDTVASPNNTKIARIRIVDAGGLGYGPLTVEIENKSGFPFMNKKIVYKDYDTNSIDITHLQFHWIDNNTISILNHTIKVP